MVTAQRECNLVNLIPKPDWSDRPITLMPILIRLYFKMRSEKLNDWCESKKKHWDAAVRGNSAARAALTELLQDEAAHNEKSNRCTLAWDMEHHQYPQVGGGGNQVRLPWGPAIVGDQMLHGAANGGLVRSRKRVDNTRYIHHGRLHQG